MATGSNKSPFTPAPDSPYSVCNPRTFDNVVGSLNDIRSLMMYQLIFLMLMGIAFMGCNIGKLDVMNDIKNSINDMITNNAETIRQLLSIIQFEVESDTCDSNCVYSPAPSSSNSDSNNDGNSDSNSNNDSESETEEVEAEVQTEGETIGESAARAVDALVSPAGLESHSSEDIINDVHNN